MFNQALSDISKNTKLGAPFPCWSTHAFQMHILYSIPKGIMYAGLYVGLTFFLCLLYFKQ